MQQLWDFSPRNWQCSVCNMAHHCKLSIPPQTPIKGLYTSAGLMVTNSARVPKRLIKPRSSCLQTCLYPEVPRKCFATDCNQFKSDKASFCASVTGDDQGLPSHNQIKSINTGANSYNRLPNVSRSPTATRKQRERFNLRFCNTFQHT